MFQNPHQTVFKISIKIGLTRGSFSKRFTIQRKFKINNKMNEILKIDENQVLKAKL